MRLFIAVAADEEVRAEAAAAVARLKKAPGDFRWVDPRDMHVTLRYFGEQPAERVPEIEALMRTAAAKAEPFELVYGRVGAFDSLEEPRVVWIGVKEGTEALKALAGGVGRDEPRPYHPHLTIGRNRREHVPPEFVAALRAETDISLRQGVTKLSLYASKPAPFGHAYEILSEAELST
jgi:RNA 2',3'-cyclic 3'-phosphodiesterase